MQLLQGDCFEVMQGLADNSVDLVLTDPPAGIGFMNCDWDKDKGGRDSWIKWMADIAAECLRVTKPGGHALVWALPRTSHWTATAWENGGWQPRDKIAHVFGTGFPKSHNGPWGGTALKPAMEDWWLLRKPLIGTVAANFAEYGTGGLNIDACRVVTDGRRPLIESKSEKSLHAFGNGLNGSKANGTTLQGRWPANLLHDGSDEVTALFPYTKSGKMLAGTVRKKEGHILDLGIGKIGDKANINETIGDSGSAARFFYAAKPSSKERDGSTHPTMKCLALMEYLCKLASCEGQVVLDPFMGSGTTGIACQKLGREFIGIEMNEEYFEIAQRRINNAVAKELF